MTFSRMAIVSVHVLPRPAYHFLIEGTTGIQRTSGTYAAICPSSPTIVTPDEA
jgi:hypothetical protein